MSQALLGLPLPALEAALAPEPPFRARQLVRWMVERRTDAFGAMSDLPRALRERLEAGFTVGYPTVVSRTPAGDGSEKLLLSLADGARVEAVLIRDGERITVCVSSQAGCALACAFCVTGRMGAGRNLVAGEILGQYLAAARLAGFGPHRANVVFMGMGEPLLNVPNVTAALDALETEVAPRRTTVSTAGIVPGIEALARRPRRPNLAVSLTAPDDALRSRLMPVNATYPIASLFAALARWPLERGRRITFEYVLIEGVNDGAAEARALARLVARVPSKVNLIPLNESPEWLPGLSRPGEEAVDAFARVLAGAGIDTTVRWSKGLGAEAACGQLKGRTAPGHLPARRSPS